MLIVRLISVYVIVMKMMNFWRMGKFLVKIVFVRNDLMLGKVNIVLVSMVFEISRLVWRLIVVIIGSIVLWRMKWLWSVGVLMFFVCFVCIQFVFCIFSMLVLVMWMMIVSGMVLSVSVGRMRCRIVFYVVLNFFVMMLFQMQKLVGCVVFMCGFCCLFEGSQFNWMVKMYFRMNVRKNIGIVMLIRFSIMDVWLVSLL